MDIDLRLLIESVLKLMFTYFLKIWQVVQSTYNRGKIVSDLQRCPLVHVYCICLEPTCPQCVCISFSIYKGT